MNRLLPVLEKIQTVVWGPPTLLLLLGNGVVFYHKTESSPDYKIGSGY